MNPQDYEYLASLPALFDRPVTSVQAQFDRLQHAGFIKKRWDGTGYELTAKARDEMQLFAQEQSALLKHQQQEQHKQAKRESREENQEAEAQAKQRREAFQEAAKHIISLVISRFLK